MPAVCRPLEDHMRLFPPTALRRRTVAGRGRGDDAHGQALVEFALVFPIFFTLVMGLIEFAFMFNALLSINYSARDGALAAAEAGNLAGADCVIVMAVDNAVGPPAVDARIQKIEIYKANADGDMVGSATVYTRNETFSNTATCAPISGPAIKYSRTADGYPELSRCNVLTGCDVLVATDSVDNIAVRVTYTHQFVTPLGNFAGGGSGSLTFNRTSVMRMEPVL
jgi:Flp pilus assembly protein TadG